MRDDCFLASGSRFPFCFQPCQFGGYVCVWRIELNALSPTYLSTESQSTFAFFQLVFFFFFFCCWQLLQIVYYLVISSPIFSMFIFFFGFVCSGFSRLKMKTLHGGPGEHRSHLHVAVFFLGGGGSFFLFRLGVRLHFFPFIGGFFCPQRT